jgi:outer membrane lipoprotein SlyB
MKKQLFLSSVALVTALALPGCCCNDNNACQQSGSPDAEEVETVTVEAVGYVPANNTNTQSAGHKTDKKAAHHSDKTADKTKSDAGK